MKTTALILTIILSSVGGTYAVRSFNHEASTGGDAGPNNGSQLQAFTENLFVVCKSNVSAARRDILVAQVTRIAQDHFGDVAQQQAFLYLLCIESRFDSRARSSAGAVGIAQILPKYASEFYGKEVKEEDLYDAEVSATIGAKRFKALLDRFDGNVALALSGYNSGADSPTTKKLARLEAGHQETMAYVARFYSLKEQMKD